MKFVSASSALVVSSVDAQCSLHVSLFHEHFAFLRMSPCVF